MKQYTIKVTGARQGYVYLEAESDELAIEQARLGMEERCDGKAFNLEIVKNKDKQPI